MCYFLEGFGVDIAFLIAFIWLYLAIWIWEIELLNGSLVPK